MWLSRLAIIALLLTALAACTGTDQTELGQVSVTVNDSRIGQLYRQRLGRLLDRHAATGTRYELTTGLKSVESEDSVTMSARLVLYDTATGRIITQRNIGAAASIGGTASLYGSDEARRFARERLAGQLAEKTYHYLIVYFARGSRP